MCPHTPISVSSRFSRRHGLVRLKGALLSSSLVAHARRYSHVLSRSSSLPPSLYLALSLSRSLALSLSRSLSVSASASLSLSHTHTHKHKSALCDTRDQECKALTPTYAHYHPASNYICVRIRTTKRQCMLKLNVSLYCHIRRASLPSALRALIQPRYSLRALVEP